MLPFDGTIKKSITIPTTMSSKKDNSKYYSITSMDYILARKSLINFKNPLKKILEI
ncbi:hypothetical protein [Methanobrevibacter gottschalkii]|uniref:hypothetical protein n=1 Tax=Methanobrevibacter gottschalkii TaxID=190974 RepID=UPI0038D0D52C